jgi:ankyrin repeat protein
MALGVAQACANGDVGVTQQLLDAGANVNVSHPSGQTALLAAIDSGHFDVVNLLVERGARLIRASDSSYFVLRDLLPGAVTERPSLHLFVYFHLAIVLELVLEHFFGNRVRTRVKVQLRV